MGIYFHAFISSALNGSEPSAIPPENTPSTPAGIRTPDVPPRLPVDKLTTLSWFPYNLATTMWSTSGRFEAVMVVLVRIEVFWEVMRHRWVNFSRRFNGSLRLTPLRVKESWRWTHQNASKRCELLAQHSALYQNVFVLWSRLLRSPSSIQTAYTVMRRSTTGILFEKCVVRRFRRCANVIQCTYTNLDSIAYCRYASLNDGDTFWEMRR
jgi:hypothetical protein